MLAHVQRGGVHEVTSMCPAGTGHGVTAAKARQHQCLLTGLGTLESPGLAPRCTAMSMPLQTDDAHDSAGLEPRGQSGLLLRASMWALAKVWAWGSRGVVPTPLCCSSLVLGAGWSR